MGDTKDSREHIFKDHKIIATESKSWYIGKPGTTQHSFSITWSPGAMVLYGKLGNITLIYSELGTYEQTKQWLSVCSFREFKGAIAHDFTEDLEFYYQALRFWSHAPHYV